MVKNLQLPFSFDPKRLTEDLARIAPAEWVPHFNKGYYSGDWSGVVLRSIAGSTNQLFIDPTRTDFLDTSIMERCPYFQEVARTFQCPLESIRLLLLSAGSKIKEHRDFGLCFEDGEFRVHIPIVTDPLVEFYLEDERLTLREGECWYIDFNLRHHIVNASAIDRIHLVIDGKVNDWVRSFFPADEVAAE